MKDKITSSSTSSSSTVMLECFYSYLLYSHSLW